MTHMRRYAPIVGALLVLVWMFAFRWEWSFIDDAGMKILVNDATSKHGIAGLWTDMHAQALADRTWGLFRPLWYVYAAFFYLANPAIAHGLRLAMFLAVILIPALRWARSPLAAVIAAAVLAANVTLYLGLSYLSLQELSGLTLVALGLLTEGPVRRSLLWLGAAWFKTPFVWLFLAWSVYLLFRRKQWAWLNIAGGIFTVVLAALASRRGTYTQGFSLANVSRAIKSAIPLLRWPGVVGVLALIALRPRPKSIAWRDPLAWVFLAGGALYLANLLPWGHADSYYVAPAIWLLSVGVLRMVLLAERAKFAMAQFVTAAAAVATLAAAGNVALTNTKQQLDRNAAVVGVREWALTVPAEQTIGINSDEGAARLGNVLHLSGSNHAVTFVPDADTSQTPTYYVVFDDQGTANPRLQKNVLHSFALATVYNTG